MYFIPLKLLCKFSDIWFEFIISVAPDDCFPHAITWQSLQTIIRETKPRGNLRMHINEGSYHLTKLWTTETFRNTNRKIKCHDLWFIILSNYIQYEIESCNRIPQSVHLNEKCQSKSRGKLWSKKNKVRFRISMNINESWDTLWDTINKVHECQKWGISLTQFFWYIDIHSQNWLWLAPISYQRIMGTFY